MTDPNLFRLKFMAILAVTLGTLGAEAAFMWWQFPHALCWVFFGFVVGMVFALALDDRPRKISAPQDRTS